MAKTRIGNNRVVCKLRVTLLFTTLADTLSFEDWYFNTIKRIGFFDVKHPKTGATVSMRFEKGEIGEEVPLTNGYHIASRSVVLEYLR